MAAPKDRPHLLKDVFYLYSINVALPEEFCLVLAEESHLHEKPGQLDRLWPSVTTCPCTVVKRAAGRNLG